MKSRWYRTIVTWVLVLAFTIIGIELIYLAAKYHTSTPPPSDEPTQNDGSNNNQPKLVWGIDTAGSISQSAFQCINDNYGKPAFVGRYLGSTENVSTGLSKEEVTFLHDNKVKILPIHNHFNNATGLDNGKSEAKEAIKLAKDVGVKERVVIIADIEPKYPVDADFLIGWTKTILDGKYKPGIYGNLSGDNLKNVYTEATKKDNTVKENLIIWTNQPRPGISTKSKAPNTFKGESPNDAKALTWQYGIDSKTCNLDTDLAKGSLLNELW